MTLCCWDIGSGLDSCLYAMQLQLSMELQLSMDHHKRGQYQCATSYSRRGPALSGVITKNLTVASLTLYHWAIPLHWLQWKPRFSGLQLGSISKWFSAWEIRCVHCSYLEPLPEGCKLAQISPLSQESIGRRLLVKPWDVLTGLMAEVSLTVLGSL